MDRENFYQLLTKLLTTLENDKYICVITNNTKTLYKDINFAIITTYNNYSVITSNKDICFTESVITSKYYDFTYYKSEREEFDTKIITMEEIKSILLQHIMDFPYFSFLYDILLDKYSKIENKLYFSHENIIYLNNPVRLILTDDEINNIINILITYKEEDENIKIKLRKK